MPIEVFFLPEDAFNFNMIHNAERNGTTKQVTQRLKKIADEQLSTTLEIGSNQESVEEVLNHHLYHTVPEYLRKREYIYKVDHHGNSYNTTQFFVFLYETKTKQLLYSPMLNIPLYQQYFFSNYPTETNTVEVMTTTNSGRYHKFTLKGYAFIYDAIMNFYKQYIVEQDSLAGCQNFDFLATEGMYQGEVMSTSLELMNQCYGFLRQNLFEAPKLYLAAKNEDMIRFMGNKENSPQDILMTIFGIYPQRNSSQFVSTGSQNFVTVHQIANSEDGLNSIRQAIMTGEENKPSSVHYVVELSVFFDQEKDRHGYTFESMYFVEVTNHHLEAIYLLHKEDLLQSRNNHYNTSALLIPADSTGAPVAAADIVANIPVQYAEHIPSDPDSHFE